MNWDTMQGDWKQFKGKVKEQWGKLTDDDLNRIEGKRDQLAGAIQKRYGIEKDEAEQQVKAFEDKCGQCEHEGARMESGSHGRQSQPMNPAGHDPAHNPNREKSATAMKEPHRREDQPAQGNDPKFQKGQGAERTMEKEKGTEKHMEGKQPGGKEQHSQGQRAKK
jgi:uncharacterized protein YjbJ (UPF0337 family)